MGQTKMTFCYWWRVIASAVTWGFHWATGGLTRLIRATAITFVTLAIFYFAGGATKFGEQLDAIVLGFMALAITIAIFIVLGLIVVPPQLDKLIREEKNAEAAKHEILAAQIKARGSKRDLVSALSDQWESGQEILESRGGSRKRGGWRSAVWTWHSRAIADLTNRKEDVTSQSLQGWQSREALKQSGNPEQSLLIQFRDSLNVMVGERDRQLALAIAEESNLDVSTKDDVQTA